MHGHSFRHLVARKHQTLVHLVGLVLGLTAFLLIQLYIRYERHYDVFHPHAQRLFRVESRFALNGEQHNAWATSSSGYLTALKEAVPAIEAGVRFWLWDSEKTIKNGDRCFHQPHVYYADAPCLEFFHLPLLRGQAATALTEPYSVVLTRSTALKVFGTVDVLGQSVEISDQDRNHTYIIRGVMEDVPGQSHLPIQALISWRSLLMDQPWQDESWYWHEAYTYVRLQPGQSPDQVEALFPEIAEAHKDREALKAYAWQIELVPVPDIHLRPLLSYERESKGSAHLVTGLQYVSWLLLLVTAFNFINLSTAWASERFREMALRRVLGASRFLLFRQFLGESLLLQGVALLMGTVLLKLAGQGFLQACGLHAQGALFLGSVSTLWGLLALVLLATAVLPSWLLARRAGRTLVGSQGVDRRWGQGLRTVLLFCQLVLVLALITTSLLASRQMQYMMRQPSGVKLSNQLVLKAPVGGEQQAHRVESFRNTLLAEAGISGMTVSSSVPGHEVGMFLANRRVEQMPTQNKEYEMLLTDWDFIDVYQLTLLAGRGFSRDRPTDAHALVINTAALHELDFLRPAQALGQRIRLEGSEREYQIIGVVANYHHQSLKTAHQPIMMTVSPEYGWIPKGYYTLSVQGDLTHQLSMIEQTWTAFFPGSAFEYFMLDDYFLSQYRPEQRFNQVLKGFTVIVVLLALLGLAGLITALLAARMKALAVRRILGASGVLLFLNLAEGFYRIWAMALVLALPLAWLAGSTMIQGFAFHIDLVAHWWIWGLSALLVAVLMGGTLLGLAWRGLHQSPVKVLRQH